MNVTQLQTTIAPIVTAIAGFLAGRGYFGFDQSTWLSILAGFVTLFGTIWGATATRKTAIVTAVANLPEVKEVKLDGESTGTTRNSVSALNIATPDNVSIG